MSHTTQALLRRQRQTISDLRDLVFFGTIIGVVAGMSITLATLRIAGVL